MTQRAMGSHHSASPITTTWLTPPYILTELGGWQSFDLDPCAAPDPRPWPTARRMNGEEDGDGLSIQWEGRVWLNPPYTSPGISRWMEKLANHGRGTALVFARIETRFFHRWIWEKASALLFLEGRLQFYHPSGEKKTTGNAGAPSVLVAYGSDDADRLEASGIKGAFVKL